VIGPFRSWAFLALVVVACRASGVDGVGPAPAPPKLTELIEEKRAIIDAFASRLPRRPSLRIPAPSSVKRGLGALPGGRLELPWVESLNTGPGQPAIPGYPGPTMVGGETLPDGLSGSDAIGLVRLGGKLHCTATLVGRKRLLLTAAHCVAGQDATDLHDPKTLTFSGGVAGELQAIPVVRLIPHPHYRYKKNPFSLTNDIAVIVLEADAGATPLRIPDRDVTARLAREKLLIVGYGYNGWNGDYLGGGSRLAVALEVRPEAGRIRFGSMQQGAYLGDSGGPALLPGSAQRVVAGVTSFVSEAACSAESVGVRTDAYLTWLHQQGL
jgi:hypothetical protein